MKQTSQKTRNGFWADFQKFAFIFVILVVAVFSVKYSGILDPDDPVDTTSSSRPPAQSTPDTPGPTDTPPVSGIETTYPIATLPSQSGGTTSPLPPINTGILPSDITDEKMNALITQKYLSINSESRSGEKLTALKNIVVHYVGNPGTSAMNNWRYFESAQGVSAHFIIGLDGEILQCMPLDEVAWAVGTTEGNYTSISIECCHPDETGKFTDATYKSLIKLVSWLCNKFGLDRSDVLRHYDYIRYTSSGLAWRKPCPKYFVDNPSEWEKFKNSLILK